MRRAFPILSVQLLALALLYQANLAQQPAELTIDTFAGSSPGGDDDYGGFVGGDTPLADIQFRNGEASFSTEGANFRAEYKGTVEDGKFSGTVDWRLDGSDGVSSFVAERQSEAPGITGRWRATIDVDGGEFQSVITIREQDGELTGVHRWPANRAVLNDPAAVAVAADGSVYFSDTDNHRVRRVRTDGTIHTVAGTGQKGFAGDDGPATKAKLHYPEGLDFGPDGSLYINDRGNHRVRRVDPLGVITTIAGGGSGGLGDGGPATKARLDYIGPRRGRGFARGHLLFIPNGLTVASDGAVYVVDSNHRVRKIDSDGIISTFAGGGKNEPQNGELATRARLSWPADIALGLDGSLYIVDRGRNQILRVKPNGLLETVAGTGEEKHAGDGGPATEAALNEPAGIAVRVDGTVFVAETPGFADDADDHHIREISAAGTITTIAGVSKRGFAGDGGPAREAKLHGVNDVAIGYDGALYLSDTGNHRIRRISGLPPAAPPKTDNLLALETFERDANGWRTVGDVSQPRHQPGGFLTAVDRREGKTWYWQMPDGAVEKLRTAYGGELRFQLKQSQQTGQYDDDDVVLVSPKNTLVHDLRASPSTAWTDFQVPLIESAWRRQESDAAIGKAEFRQALSKATALHIRGEYSSQEDTGAIDNVFLFGNRPRGGPNLSLTRLAVPLAATTTEPLEISWLVEVAPGEALPADCSDGIYLSTDDSLDDLDRSLAQVEWKTPTTAKEHRRRAAVSLSDADPGLYYIIVKVDDSDEQEESDERDNVLARPIHLTASLRLSAYPDRLSLTLRPQEPRSAEATVTNLSATQLEGIEARVVGAEPNVDVQLNVPSQLGPSESAEVGFTVTAEDDSILEGEAVIELYNSEALLTSLALETRVDPDRPLLVSAPGYLEKGMLPGTQRSVECEIFNGGNLPAHDLRVTTTQVPWIGLYTPETIDVLRPGERVAVGLRASPPHDLPTGVYSGEIKVSGEDAAVTIKYRFHVVSDAEGTLQVRATDEYTYFSDEKPLVAGASVQLTAPSSGETVASGKTNEDGVFVVETVGEGRYNLRVFADRHASYSGTVAIVPGQTVVVEAFLQRRMVTYQWTVAPMEYEDRYTITLDAVFETHVPAPVVTVEPIKPVFMLDDEPRRTSVTLTNHGLIAAHDVRFPAVEGQEVIIEPLHEEIGTLPALTSVVIPVEVRYKEEAIARRAGAGSGARVSAYTACCGAVPRRSPSRSRRPRGDARPVSTAAGDVAAQTGKAGGDAGKDECLVACVEYFYVCGEKRRNHVCTNFKVFKDVLKRLGELYKALSSLEGALAEVEKQLVNQIDDPELKKLAGMIQKTRQLLTDGVKCLTALEGNAAGLQDCLSGVCTGLELYNQVLQFAKEKGYALGESVEEAKCICAAISVAKLSSPPSLGTVADAVDAGEKIHGCLCEFELATVVGEAGNGRGIRFVPRGGGGVGHAIRVSIRCD